MKTKFAVICSAWLSLTLGAVNQLQAFPVIYTYNGDAYSNSNAPCTPGFSNSDHMFVTFTLDSEDWGEENYRLEGAELRSGPIEVGLYAYVTTDQSGRVISWYMFGYLGGGGVYTDGDPDGSGNDGIASDRLACGIENYVAGTSYAAGSRVPADVWTMEISPTPTPTPTPAPTATPARCVLGHAYWMNHPETWCMEAIDIAGVTYTQGEAIALMRHGSGRDKTYSQMEALITARLNVACKGANASYIRCHMTVADNFICHYPVGSDVRPNSPEWRYIRDIYYALVNFNAGRSGDPSCGPSLP